MLVLGVVVFCIDMRRGDTEIQLKGKALRLRGVVSGSSH